MADKFDKLKKLGIGFERPPYNLVNHLPITVLEMSMKPSESSKPGTLTSILEIQSNTLAEWTQRETQSKILKKLAGISQGRLIISKTSTENNRDNSQSSEDEV